MHKTSFLISLFLIISYLQTSAMRTLYVDDFENILGDIPAENALLNYAQSHNIQTLLLYSLHIVHANYDLPNPATNHVLADFISKAKNNYGISYVGASAENEDFFTNVIDSYNNSRSNPSEKFDIYNLEFEYWNSPLTGPGGYYCTTYLAPNGIPCTENGAFQYFMSIVGAMNTLATNNTHSITTEAYVGWPSASQAQTIGSNLDRVRVHAYVSNPNNAFGYSDDRLIDFANGNPNINISIIFSSEPSFMQNWLENNSMLEAENIYTNDWINESSTWSNNINLEGFTYFTYTDMTSVILPVEFSYFKGQQINSSIQLNWETLSEINSDYFEVERKHGNEFHTIGNIKSSENSSTKILYHYNDKNPNIGINYYRLKQVDLDGSFIYSNTIAIPYNEEEEFKIFPTLAKESIFIQSPNIIHKVSIYNTNGQKIKELNNLTSSISKININDIISGIYLLNIESDSVSKTFRFIKQY